MSQYLTEKRADINEYHEKLINQVNVEVDALVAVYQRSNSSFDKQSASDLISLRSKMIAEIERHQAANVSSLETSWAAGLLTAESSPYAAGFCAFVEKTTLDLLVPGMRFPCAALVVFSSFGNKNFDECLRKWHSERRNDRREILQFYDPEMNEVCSVEDKFDWKKSGVSEQDIVYFTMLKQHFTQAATATTKAGSLFNFESLLVRFDTNLEQLTELCLSENKLARLRKDMFRSLSNLETLSLADNKLEHIKSDAWTHVTQLKRLDLHGNKLIYYENIFSGLSNLEELNLRSTRYTWCLSHDERVWVDLSTDDQDRHLTLSTGFECEGLIRSYDPKRVLINNKQGVWSHMSKLKTLDLSYNSRAEIHATSTFSGLSNLENLDLSHCKLKKMPSGVLCHMTNLKKLMLDNNELEHVDEQMFSGLSSLEELDMSENSGLFKGIDVGAFAHMSQLRKLSIGCCPQSGKQPISIHAGTFSGLVALQHLCLYNLAIERIEKGSLSHLSNLQFLRLRGNRLSRVDKELLGGLDNLELLNLVDNRIEHIENGSFSHMTKLKELHLSMNPLQRLDAQVLGGLANLETLAFTFSARMKHLDPDSLDHMSKLSELSIENYGRKNSAILGRFKRNALTVNPQLKINILN